MYCTQEEIEKDSVASSAALEDLENITNLAKEEVEIKKTGLKAIGDLK